MINYPDSNIGSVHIKKILKIKIIQRIGAKYLAAKKGYKSTAGIFTHVLQPLLGTATADKAFKLINGIFPDFVIDARGPRFSELLEIMDSSRLDGVETLADIKGLGIGESSGYVSFRAEQGQLKPIDRRAVKVHKEYCKAATSGPKCTGA